MNKSGNSVGIGAPEAIYLLIAAGLILFDLAIIIMCTVIHAKTGSYPLLLTDVLQALRNGAEANYQSTDSSFSAAGFVGRGYFVLAGLFAVEFILSLIIAIHGGDSKAAIPLVAFPVGVVGGIAALISHMPKLLSVLIFIVVLIALLIIFVKCVWGTDGAPYCFCTVALVLAHLLLRPFLIWFLSLGVVRMILLVLAVLAVVGFIALSLHSDLSSPAPSGTGRSNNSGGNSRSKSSSNNKEANKRTQDRIDILYSNIKYRNGQLAKKAADKRVVADYNKRDLEEIARLKKQLK